VWHDLDGDGAQGAGETGLSNVVVRLLDADQNIVTSVVTDAQGLYAFDNPGTAERTVQVLAPSNYAFTAQNAAGASDLADSDVASDSGNTEPVTVASGETNLTVDAGLFIPARVHGYLFKDKNGDSVRNTFDSSITGATVRLVNNGAVVATATSSNLGYYHFDSVAPGAVSILVTRVSSTLVAVPTVPPASTNECRSRALPDYAGLDAYIACSVVSGLGVLPEVPSETLNFGFLETYLSSALDLSVHGASDNRVVIDLWTADESGSGDIVVYAWINSGWVEVARLPSAQLIGEGSNHYTFDAAGLNIGVSYRFKIVDEAGHEHFLATPIKVKTFRAHAVRLEMNTFTITFDSERGNNYAVLVSDRLVPHPTPGCRSMSASERATPGRPSGARLSWRRLMNRP
jgi:hypothetical protein